MSNKKTMATIYTLLHFLVDLTTIYLVSGVLLGPKIGVVQRGLVVIVYNLLAFAGQLPIGILSDVVNKNLLFVTWGCLLAGISYPVAFVSPWIACVLAAIGNGAFHIGAGSDILKSSMPKAGLSGLFVSSGALGVWLAYELKNEAVIIILPVVMLVCAVVLFILNRDTKKEDTVTPPMFVKLEKVAIAAIICFLMTIVIRSLMGMIMNYSWKSVFPLSLVSVLAVFAGKALGGYIGDKWGYIKTAVVSLSVSLVLFVFSFDYWIAGVIAILCFNMTMPLTLTAIADLTDKKYGFAFGMTTFALAMGFIPVVFGINSWFSIPFILACTGVSLLLIVSGYALVKKCKQDR